MSLTSPRPRFWVLVADFLDEAAIETEILGDLADLTLAQAFDETALSPYLEPQGAGSDAQGPDAVLLFHDLKRLSAASFKRMTRCKVVVRAGVGFDNVDLDAANQAGIPVCNVPDYGTEEVADHALMLLLAVARRLIDCDRPLRQGRWNASFVHGAPRLRGKTLGLVGCGRIGTAMVLRAKPLGLRVMVHDPKAVRGLDKALGVERVETLAELAAQADFLSLHCPLDSSTYHLINHAIFSVMKPGAILINTARGPVVDETALLEALERGPLAGAGLDVLESEPPAAERLTALLNHPRVIVTPHVAFYSVEGYRELRHKAAHEVRRALLGQPLWNVVNAPQPRSGGELGWERP